MKNNKEIRISAKDLGAMALPDFCPRCFWVKRKIKKVPFQIFPGIFSTIDAYTKHVMHMIFDAYLRGNDPASYWIRTNMPHIATAKRWLKVPHWSKFTRFDPASGITLSGVPDDFYEIADGQNTYHVMPDYKTAKYTENQDKLLPMYRVQQNGYKWIGGINGYNVIDMPLCYCEPLSLNDAMENEVKVVAEGGFLMAFRVKCLEIAEDQEYVLELMQKYRDLIEKSTPPEGLPGCKDCQGLDKIVLYLNKEED